MHQHVNIAILLFSLFKSISSNTVLLVEPPPEVRAFPGQNVTLPCIFKNFQHSEITASWDYIGDTIVHITDDRRFFKSVIDHFQFSFPGEGNNFTLHIVIPESKLIDFEDDVTVTKQFKFVVTIKETHEKNIFISNLIIQKTPTCLSTETVYTSFLDNEEDKELPVTNTTDSTNEYYQNDSGAFYFILLCVAIIIIIILLIVLCHRKCKTDSRKSSRDDNVRNLPTDLISDDYQTLQRMNNTDNRMVEYNTDEPTRGQEDGYEVPKQHIRQDYQSLTLDTNEETEAYETIPSIDIGQSSDVTSENLTYITTIDDTNEQATAYETIPSIDRGQSSEVTSENLTYITTLDDTNEQATAYETIPSIDRGQSSEVTSENLTYITTLDGRPTHVCQ